MAPKLSLIYFPARARGETARMIMAYGDIAFTNTSCREYFGCSFLEAKTSGKLPFGQLPVLAVDDTLLSQSGAINRQGELEGGRNRFSTESMHGTRFLLLPAQPTQITP